MDYLDNLLHISDLMNLYNNNYPLPMDMSNYNNYLLNHQKYSDLLDILLHIHVKNHLHKNMEMDNYF